MSYTAELSEKAAKTLDKLEKKDRHIPYLLRETVLPFRMSSMPSRMSFISALSDRISSVSFMLSYSPFRKVTVSAILGSNDAAMFKNLSISLCKEVKGVFWKIIRLVGSKTGKLYLKTAIAAIFATAAALYTLTAEGEAR